MRIGFASIIIGVLAASPVLAADVTPAAPAPEAAASDASPSVAPLLGPLGDPWGSRTFLAAHGITYNLTYIGELWGVTSGGMERGRTYDGRLEFSLDADLGKLVGWEGAKFHTNVYNIQGKGPSAHYANNQLTISNIEALPTTRLSEFWIEQSFLNDKAALKIGQIAADTEFLVSEYGGIFINGTFGWPAINGTNMPAGGPAYPLATPGVRLKLAPNDDFSLLAALFNGNPAGNTCVQNPQHCDNYGMPRFGDGIFAITEAAYSYNKGNADALPGTVKVGAWYNSNEFSDHRHFSDGEPVIATDGDERKLRGDWGVYGMIDQMIYRVEGRGDAGVGVFARISAVPSSRNLIDFYLDGGVNFKGLWAERPNDVFGIAFAYAKISDASRAYDRDNIIYNALYQPIRNYEAVIEATYQAQIVPGWTVQPDFQYIINPGGNVLNPNDPYGLQKQKNAVVIGLRTTIRY